MEAIPEHGRLDEIPLPRLLLGLQRGQFGGAVTLSRERVGKRFLFRDGLPIFAESNLASESLGVQLMDAGRITRSDYNRLTSHVAQEACKEGRALLDLGLLDAKGLFLALKEQVRIRLLECFGWPHGEFFVDAGCEPPPDAQPFRTEIFSLLQEGIEAHWSSDRVLADLHSRMELFPELSARSERITGKLRSDDAVVALLSALDGTHSLWRLIQAAKTPRGLATIWVLDAAGALHYRDAAKPDSDLAGDACAQIEIVTIAEPEASPAPRPAAAPPRHRPNEVDANATAKLRGEIGAKHARLSELDYYQLLELPEDCDAAAIKHAYHVAAKIYHPDTLARSGLDSDARAEANRVFAEISKAHATLSDPERRVLYDEERRGGGTSGIDANRLANAEGFYRKGEILMRQGNFRGAFEFLKPAVDLWPDECAYQSALGWTYYKKTPSEPEVARQHLERALALDAEDGVTLFRLGVVLRALGQTEAGAAAHERASRLGGGGG